jgi:GNAT superfamily N-acetyltransferase
MLIRPLDPVADRAAVLELHDRAADYVRLETGQDPTPERMDDYFQGAPPGIDPVTSSRLGLFDTGRLAVIADLAFGWPEPTDAYIGLMLAVPEARGQGLGHALVAHVKATARARGATRLLLAVLDDNPRGRAFWEREGFRVVLTFPPSDMGGKTHVRHRMSCLL